MTNSIVFYGLLILLLFSISASGCRSSIISEITPCDCSVYGYPIKEHAIQIAKAHCRYGFMYSVLNAGSCICFSDELTEDIGNVYQINVRCMEE